MTGNIDVNKWISPLRLDGDSAVAFTEKMLSAADRAKTAYEKKGEIFPSAISSYLQRITRSLNDLKTTTAHREDANAPNRRAAAYMLDSAWRSFADWLTAMTVVPSAMLPGAERVHALNALLFSEGLSFLKRPYWEEWVQSASRLNIIKSRKFVEVIDTLGGSPLLTHLRTAHNAYSEALNVRAKVVAGEESTVCPALLQLVDDLEIYIAKVIAWNDSESSDSEALVEALLLPLENWKAPPTHASAATSSRGAQKDECTATAAVVGNV